MTLTDCQLLSIVAQLGTFAAAAERLHITPSAVSHAVSGVEAECGFPLFTRTKSGVTLTAAAEKLMPAIQQMLASSESLDQSIAQINGMHKGALRLGVFNSACVTWLPQLVPQFQLDFPGIDVWAEPGRYICGTAVNLITSVIGVNERGGQPWYFLDEGLYGTFSGVIFDQWDFKLISFKEGEERVAATFAGPSCDSLDIMFRGKMTVPLEVGDLLLVPSCGAYTSASATTFNGFSKAQFVVWEDIYDSFAAAE